MGDTGLSHSNRAAMTTTTDRWDSAAVGSANGTKKYTVPAGAVAALITTNKPIYVACGAEKNAYESDKTTAFHADGVILAINEGAVANESARPVHRIPVSAGQVLHVKDAGARATIHLTFLLS